LHPKPNSKGVKCKIKQEDSIRDMAYNADSISSKASRRHVLIEHHPNHLN
jgi:hypothetical protein